MSNDTPNPQKSTDGRPTDTQPTPAETCLENAIDELQLVAEELDEQRATWLQVRVLQRLDHLGDQLQFDREFGFDRSLGAEPAEQVEVEL